MDHAAEIDMTGEYDRRPARVVIQVRCTDAPNTAEIGVRIATFRLEAHYLCYVLWEDVRTLARRVRVIHESLTGEASIGEADGMLSFRVVDPGAGRIVVSGSFRHCTDTVAKNDAGLALRFDAFVIDQSLLPELARQLELAWEGKGDITH